MRTHLWGMLLVLGLTLILQSGCSGPVAQPKIEDVQENLSVVAKAYLEAAQKNKKPPMGVADIKPFLPKDADMEKVMRSARDGEPFVIIWGTDPQTGMDVNPLVVGYEKKGKGGKRVVFTVMGVVERTDADFGKANFPPGHKP